MSPASGRDERSAALLILDRFRREQQMREMDGWRLVQLDRETRDRREVFAFILECSRTAPDGSCDRGDRVFGYVDAGELTVEQFT